MIMSGLALTFRCGCGAAELTLDGPSDAAFWRLAQCGCHFCYQHDTQFLINTGGALTLSGPLRRYHSSKGHVTDLICKQCGADLGVEIDNTYVAPNWRFCAWPAASAASGPLHACPPTPKSMRLALHAFDCFQARSSILKRFARRTEPNDGRVVIATRRFARKG